MAGERGGGQGKQLVTTITKMLQQPKLLLFDLVKHACDGGRVAIDSS